MKLLDCSQGALCLAISAMDSSISADEFEDALSVTCENMDVESSVEGSKGVLPLVVACSSANITALNYLVSMGRPELVGTPLQKMTDDRGGGCAVHHAASSGFLEAIKSFHSMGCSIKEQMIITNKNVDTPLMMAAKDGHLGFLKGLVELAVDIERLPMEEVKAAFEMRNKDGNSCITLSCNHGHVLVVQWLLSEIGVEFSVNDFTTCHAFVCDIEQKLTPAKIPDPEILQSYQIKHNRVKEAYSLLAEIQDKKAAEAEAALLSLDDDKVPDTTSQKNTKKKKGKAAKKKNQKARTGAAAKGKAADLDRVADQNETIQSEEQERVELKTLEDGRNAVAVNGNTYTIHPKRNPITAPLGMPEKADVDEMFRERVKGSVASSDEQIDEVMNALCLDVSMLLYTTHSFALNLSPSQLHTVEQILEKQLKAIREAKQIQERMHVKE